jgi:YgiT-type zinc finger domain-containing protein
MTERLTKNTAEVSDVVYCDFCGGEMKPQKVTMLYFRKGGAHLFHNVEAEVCQKCGEKYYHARTLADLDISAYALGEA